MANDFRNERKEVEQMNLMFKIGQEVWTLMDNQVIRGIQVKKGTINKISFDGKISIDIALKMDARNRRKICCCSR